MEDKKIGYEKDVSPPENHTPEEWPLVVDKMEDYLNDSKELKHLTKKGKETVCFFKQKGSADQGLLTKEKELKVDNEVFSLYLNS